MLNPWEFAADADENESPGTAANSQCTLFGRAARVNSAPGDSIVDLSFELAFSPAFRGEKNIYAAYEFVERRAADDTEPLDAG